MNIRILLFALVCTAAFAQPELNLMPMPEQATRTSGELDILQAFAVSVHGDARLQRAALRFLDQLARQTGMPIAEKTQAKGVATLTVTAEHSAKDIPELGEDESYNLTVAPDAARITAPTTRGAMYGLQTFLQLVQPGPHGFLVPAVNIQDSPRFSWRGLMIDACRHWMPPEVIKRNLDGMAAAKLNVLHWHLSEDQGVRVESKKFPKLQQLSSDGHYYTQDEIKDIVRYAADRGIRVLPEFDMPGHSSAWFVAYPDLASGPGPFQIQQEFGVFDPVFDPTRDSTYKFLDKFIGEMARLFPDRYWHIGGDEVNGKQWDANPKIQEFMRTHNLKDNAALQAYFNQRLLKILEKKHKRMVGWDEIFQPELPKDIVVQSWRGPKSLAETARAGYDSILSNGFYLDFALPASKYYAVEPLSGDAAALTPDEQKHVLGGEACMWAELVSPETVDSRIWPNTAAIAERLWSPAGVNDADSMYPRLMAFSRELDFLGVMTNSDYEPMLDRLAGSGDVEALHVLADVVEPMKNYGRHNARHYTNETPLNRLPDAVRPESQTARLFGLLVERILSGQASPIERETARLWLRTWRDNNARLEPTIQQSFLLQEDAGLSRNLSQIADIGLKALDAIETHATLDANWRAQQLELLAEAEKPQAELLLKIVDPVRKLVEFTAQ